MSDEVKYDASAQTDVIEGDARGRVAETNLEAAIPPVMIPPSTTIT